MASNFKKDDSFLRKLIVGAAGTNTTMNRLKALGFTPIELERGSTGFKIWKKIKIKRIRVPDILCLDTGLRFESRGKTKLEISMSHSLNDPKRAWDAGMRDDDFISIVAFEQKDEPPIEIKPISPVHFVCVRDLREVFAAGQVSVSRPKGVEEGSEIRVIWPSAVANQTSVVTTVESDKIQLTPSTTQRRQSIQCSRHKGKITLLPQSNVGDIVTTNQIVAAVVPVYTSLLPPAPVDDSYFVDRLESINLTERYAAAKALRYRGYTTAERILESRMNDSDEDIYVQLEAAATLAAHHNAKGWKFLEEKLHRPVMEVPLETQLETLIVASEIPQNQSEQWLVEILQDPSRDMELRAGAAWALGQFSTMSSASALVDSFDASPVDVKFESARALLKIAEPQLPILLDLLKKTTPSKRHGLAWVLARIGQFNPSDLLSNSDENLRMWLSYIVGYGREHFVQTDIETLLQTDPHIYFAASVLWQILSSWINNLKEY